MKEQLIEKLKELINDINTFEQINKKYTNSILSEAIQALTSVKSESAEYFKESLEKKARDWEFKNIESADSDYHSYRAGYIQAVHDFANSKQIKVESAEEVEKQSIQPKEQLSAEEVLEKTTIEWGYKSVPFMMKYASMDDNIGIVIQAMHDFANNSEAMKENAIGFAEFCQADEKCRTLDDLYTEYLTNKEKNNE